MEKNRRTSQEDAAYTSPSTKITRPFRYARRLAEESTGIDGYRKQLADTYPSKSWAAYLAALQVLAPLTASITTPSYDWGKNEERFSSLPFGAILASATVDIITNGAAIVVGVETQNVEIGIGAKLGLNAVSNVVGDTVNASIDALKRKQKGSKT